jgi:hypothetical protein
MQSSVLPAPAGQTQVPAPPPAPVAEIPGVATFPMSAREIRGIRARRGELSSQLSSAESRRSALARQLRGADPAARTGLEARIGVLDKRIVQLEADIAETGRQLTSAPAGPALAGVVDSLGPDAMTGVVIVFTLAVLMPLSVAWARRIWRRGKAIPESRESTENARRLARIEEAVDTIAIEIERISENQRFVTRVMTERGPAARQAGFDSSPAMSPEQNAEPLALSAGEAPVEPIAIRQAETARVSRNAT